MIRNMRVFANTHLFADATIFITLLVIVAAGIDQIKMDGSELSTVDLINLSGASHALGISFFTFEGFGVLLPVQDLT